MANLQELNGYRGDANLANGTSGNNTLLGVVNFGRMDAVDRFAAFSMQRERDEWTQNNLLLQQQSAEAARSLPVKYGNLIPEDRAVVDEKVKAMYDFYHKNPNAVRYMVDPRTGKDNAEAYGEFQRLKNELDHTIVRGNQRAIQLVGMEGALTQTTDPARAQLMREALERERKKPISENLIIPPNIAPFNLSKWVETVSAAGARNYEFLQRFPNSITTNTRGLFDPNAAAAAANTQLLDPTGDPDLKRTIGETTALFNTVLQKHTKTDANGRTFVDIQAMRADESAGPILGLLETYNQQIDVLNNTETVENGQTTRKRVREFLGYTQDIPRIDLNGKAASGGFNSQDVLRLLMSGKMGMTSQVKSQFTGEQLTRYNIDVDDANKDADRRLRREELEKGEKEAEQIAQEKLNLFYNTFMTPNSGGTFVNETETTAYYDRNGKKVENPQGGVDSNGNPINSTTRKIGGGWEVAVSEPLADAFKIPVNKGTQKVKRVITDENGDQQEVEESATEQTAIMPRRMFVVQPKGKGINARTLRVEYENGQTRDFSTGQAFTAMNGMFGDDPKMKAAISGASMRVLGQYGLTNPDLNLLGRRISRLDEQGGQGAAGSTTTSAAPAAPATAPRTPRQTGQAAGRAATGKKPKPY